MTAAKDVPSPVPDPELARFTDALHTRRDRVSAWLAAANVDGETARRINTNTKYVTSLQKLLSALGDDDTPQKAIRNAVHRLGAWQTIHDIYGDQVALGGELTAISRRAQVLNPAADPFPSDLWYGLYARNTFVDAGVVEVKIAGLSWGDIAADEPLSLASQFQFLTATSATYDDPLSTEYPRLALLQQRNALATHNAVVHGPPLSSKLPDHGPAIKSRAANRGREIIEHVYTMKDHIREALISPPSPDDKQFIEFVRVLEDSLDDERIWMLTVNALYNLGHNEFRIQYGAIANHAFEEGPYQSMYQKLSARMREMLESTADDVFFFPEDLRSIINLDNIDNKPSDIEVDDAIVERFQSIVSYGAAQIELTPDDISFPWEVFTERPASVDVTINSSKHRSLNINMYFEIEGVRKKFGITCNLGLGENLISLGWNILESSSHHELKDLMDGLFPTIVSLIEPAVIAAEQKAKQVYDERHSMERDLNKGANNNKKGVRKKSGGGGGSRRGPDHFVPQPKRGSRGPVALDIVTNEPVELSPQSNKKRIIRNQILGLKDPRLVDAFTPGVPPHLLPVVRDALVELQKGGALGNRKKYTFVISKTPYGPVEVELAQAAKNRHRVVVVRPHQPTRKV